MCGSGGIKLKEKGISLTLDLLSFALMITLASILLFSGLSMETGPFRREDYAERLAQSTLISLQQAPVGEIGDFFYYPQIQAGSPSGRRMNRKTITQLIIEDAILNPIIISEGRIGTPTINSDFDEKLTDLLEKVLDKWVGNRFGYRLLIWTPKIKLPEKRWFYFRKVVEDFDGNSEKLCSKNIALNLLIPREWIETSKDFPEMTERKTHLPLRRADGKSDPKITRVNMKVEIWSH